MQLGVKEGKEKSGLEQGLFESRILSWGSEFFVLVILVPRLLEGMNSLWVLDVEEA